MEGVVSQGGTCRDCDLSCRKDTATGAALYLKFPFCCPAVRCVARFLLLLNCGEYIHRFVQGGR